MNLILVLAAHETAHSTAPRARLQNGLHRPGDYGVYGRPRTIFSPERLSPAGAARDFKDTREARARGGRRAAGIGRNPLRRWLPVVAVLVAVAVNPWPPAYVRSRSGTA